MVFVLGLTGGICSGKTTITKILQQQQSFQPLHIINADLLGHQTYQIGATAYLQIIETFGKENILHPETKEIDRIKLGNIVFKDSSCMLQLTNIVWPEIRKLIIQQIEIYKQQEIELGQLIIVVLEAAILFEAKWQDLCHRIWLLVTRFDDALPRLLQRNPHLTIEQATDRILSQMKNIEEKKTLANQIIENNQDLSLNELEKKVVQLLRDEVQLT